MHYVIMIHPPCRIVAFRQALSMKLFFRHSLKVPTLLSRSNFQNHMVKVLSKNVAAARVWLAVIVWSLPLVRTCKKSTPDTRLPTSKSSAMTLPINFLLYTVHLKLYNLYFPFNVLGSSFTLYTFLFTHYALLFII